jgi:F-type H+-transporting ATPase subunit delta
VKSTSQLTARSKIAKRYALALFGCAQEQKSLDSIYKDLMVVSQGIEGSPEFYDFLQNPAVSFRKFKTVVESLFKHKLDPLLWQFFDFLRQHDRLDILREICSEFERSYFGFKEVLKVKIISARELKSEQLESIEKRLKARFKKEIIHELEINPQLIGGFKVQIGGVIYDYSVENQLANFKKQLLSN